MITLRTGSAISGAGGSISVAVQAGTIASGTATSMLANHGEDWWRPCRSFRALALRHQVVPSVSTRQTLAQMAKAGVWTFSSGSSARDSHFERGDFSLDGWPVQADDRVWRPSNDQCWRIDGEDWWRRVDRFVTATSSGAFSIRTGAGTDVTGV